MKTLSLFFVIAMICVLPAHSQSFSSATLKHIGNHNVISFTIPSESNTRYYRVEASNDNVSYEVIGTVRSTGNSVLAKNYSYKSFEPAYKYYRVGMVGSGANLQYSSVISTGTENESTTPGIQDHKEISGPAIVTNHSK